MTTTTRENRPARPALAAQPRRHQAPPRPFADPTFKRRQRVFVRHGVGDEAATVVRPDKTWAGWYIVEFDAGGSACVRYSGLKAMQEGGAQ